jgi:hypothetical protein
MASALKCPMWKLPETYANLRKTNPDYLALLNQNGFERLQSRDNGR